MQEAARGPRPCSRPRVLLRLGSPRAAPGPAAPAVPSAPAARTSTSRSPRPAGGWVGQRGVGSLSLTAIPAAAARPALQAAVVPVLPRPMVAATGAVGGKPQHGAAQPFLRALALLAGC